MAKKTLIFVLIFVILGGLFLLFKSFAPTPSSLSESNQNTASSSAKTITPKVFELVIENKKVIKGPETIQVSQGDEVIINITSDTEEEFHLHGYDKSVDLTPNQPSELKLTANLSGRFSYELENSKTELGALEVQPK